MRSSNLIAGLCASRGTHYSFLSLEGQGVFAVVLITNQCFLASGIVFRNCVRNATVRRYDKHLIDPTTVAAHGSDT